MHLSLTITAAIAATLDTSANLTAGVYQHGSTTDRATPLLAVICQNFSSPHHSLHQGEIILRYEYDADTITAAAAALDLQAAADYLLDPDGLAAVNALLAPDSIWLRKLTNSGGASAAAETGERTRSMDIALPFRAQTKI